MGKSRFQLPATFEMVAWFTDGETIGKATISLPVGVYPTKEEIDKMMSKAVEELKDSGLHLCDPHEFGSAYLMEKTGQRIAVPGTNEWAD